MSARNGRLTRKDLAPVPGGFLRKDAAAAWNAMCAKAASDGLPVPRPGGPDSSYRPLARQVFWRHHWTKQGKPENAAVPGTSNHGEGIAVDVPDATHRQTIDSIGAAYGWQKRWSDAPHEKWHLKWRVDDYPAVRKAAFGAEQMLTASELSAAREYRRLKNAGSDRPRRVVLRQALIRARKRAWRALQTQPTERNKRRYALLHSITR
jgi:hypothetical protein